MRLPDSAYQSKVAAPTGPKLNFDPLPHQEQVADKLEDESGQVMYHSLGSGKCVRGSTLVYTSKGICRIDSLWGTDPLAEDKTEETRTVEGLYVQGRNGPVKVKALYRQRIPADEPTYRVTTKRGNTIESTGQHRFLAPRNGKTQWIRAAELSPTDSVAMSKAPMTVLPSEIPAGWSIEETQFLLWQVYEGYEGTPKYGIGTVTQKDVSLLQWLLGLSGPLGIRAKIREYPYHCAFLCFSGPTWRKKLESVGYEWGHRSAGKRLPLVVFSSSTLLAYIIDIMLDAEGSVDLMVEFPSASPYLVHGVQSALTYFGIRSALHSKRGRATNGLNIYRTYYRTSVSGEDLDTLKQMSKAAKASKIEVKKRNPNFGIPVKDVYDVLYTYGILGACKDVGVHPGQDSLSDSTVASLIDRLSSLYSVGYTVLPWMRGMAQKWALRTAQGVKDNASKLPPIIEDLKVRREFRWEPLKSIEAGELGGVVYDLEVEAVDDQACYIAGSAGFVTHNTKAIVNAAHKHNLPLIAIVPAALRNNMRKEISSSGFKHPAQVLSYEEALKRLKDPDFREQASNSLVAFDEAHRASSEISQRKTLFEDLPAKKKLLATATPARNHPSELAPLINAIEPGSLPDTQREFNKKYVETRKTPQSFMGWFTGQKPETTQHPKNMEDFQQAIKGKVDFYQATDRTHFPSSDESTIEVPMSSKQQAAYNMVMGKYPMLWYKIRHGLPPSKSDEADFKAFMSGPRQVMNHPAPYNASATDADAPKIKAAVDEIEARHNKDKNFRGVTYSAYLGSGIHPLSRELTARNIPHAMFTGDQTEDERKHIVESYNKGKLPVLLISGAGSEGLDLKGTKLMQIMEPHWNEELIDQVRGRAIRYKSHDALPEDERHVEVQRFHSVPAPSWVDSMLGRHRGSDQSADEYLYNHAQKKRELLAPFLNAMQGKTSSAGGPSVIPCPERQLVPGLLVDLDDTLVHVPGAYGPVATGQQVVLPGRLEALKAFKDKGYKIIAITNRSTKHIPLLPLLQVNQETMGMFEGLLDDLICCPEHSEDVHKPAPTMLLYAMHKHNLNPDNLLMVGDSENDQGAAEAANVQYVHPSVFFSTDWTNMPDAEAAPINTPYGMSRWVHDPSGNFVGALACCGQDAVAALKARIDEEASRRSLPPPRTIACEEGLSIIIPADCEDFAAWVDGVYDECLPPVE